MTRSNRSELVSGEYRVLRVVQAGAGEALQHIGVPGVCRFCGRRGSEHFKGHAHLIPEALGNRWLVSDDECDSCNQLFSRYDGALVNAVSPLLTVGGVPVKGGGSRQVGRSAGDRIARHSRQDGKRQLTFLANNVSLEQRLQMTARGHVHLEIPIAPVPFKPRYAFKALSKIGLALLPPEMLPDYSQQLSWLQSPEDGLDFPILEVGLSFGSIGNAPPTACAALLQRIDARAPIPNLYLVVCVGSVCAQLALMSDYLEDHLPPTTMGSIRIKWANVLGSGAESIRIEYGDVYPFNWSASTSEPQPIESLRLGFDPQTTQGWFTPVLRTRPDQNN